MRFDRLVLALIVLFPFLIAGDVVSHEHNASKALANNTALIKTVSSQAAQIERLQNELRETLDQLQALDQQIITDQVGSTQKQQQLYDQAVALSNQLRHLGVRPVVTVSPTTTVPGRTTTTAPPRTTSTTSPPPTTTTTTPRSVTCALLGVGCGKGKGPS